jgi:hypothetical protein
MAASRRRPIRIPLDDRRPGSLQSAHSTASQQEKGQAMTNIFIMIFFGVALVIGIYFTWLLLRNEMAGRPKPPPDPYDFGFGPPQPDPKSRH